jgi:hypothetical protein
MRCCEVSAPIEELLAAKFLDTCGLSNEDGARNGQRKLARSNITAFE